MIIREACGSSGVLAVAGVTGQSGRLGDLRDLSLFSMCAVIEAMGQAFFDNVWAIDKMIRRARWIRFGSSGIPVYTDAWPGDAFSGYPEYGCVCGDPCLVYPGNRTFYRRAGNHIADRIYHLRYDDQFWNLYDF